MESEIIAKLELIQEQLTEIMRILREEIIGA